MAASIVPEGRVVPDWSGAAAIAVPKSKLEHLDVSWNNLGRKLADERTSAQRSLVHRYPLERL